MKLNSFTYHPLLITLMALLLLLIGAAKVSAQGVVLDKFDVFQHNDQVFLSWVIARGSTCNGIQVERSTDNLVFEMVGYIGGVCGSASEPRPYSFIDQNPVKNQTNYYRLELGNQGYSETQSLEFQVFSAGLTVGPNPAQDETKIRFSNPFQDPVNLEIYNLSGRLVRELQGNSNTFQLDLSSFQDGVYLLRLTHKKNGETHTSRLVVARQ